jgi:hypothetical protein
VKILGVPGKKLIPGMEDATTHDFLLIRAPTAPTRTAAEFTALVYAAEKPALILFRMLPRVGLVRTFQIISSAARGLGVPLMPLASTSYTACFR